MSATSSKSNPGSGAVNPINLRERFGRRFQIGHDPAFEAEDRRLAKADEPWLQIIPGRLGHVYPFGGDTLAATTNSCGPVANKLKASPFCEVWQDGSDGVTVLFRVDHFPRVAKILHLRTRRQLSDGQRRGLEYGRKHRFKNKHGDETGDGLGVSPVA